MVDSWRQKDDVNMNMKKNMNMDPTKPIDSTMEGKRNKESDDNNTIVIGVNTPKKVPFWFRILRI